MTWSQVSDAGARLLPAGSAYRVGNSATRCGTGGRSLVRAGWAPSPRGWRKNKCRRFDAPAFARGRTAVQRTEFDATCEEVKPTFHDAGTCRGSDIAAAAT